MVKFAFALFIFLYPLYDNHKTELRVVDSINQTRIGILKEIEKLKPEEVTATYYVVQREAKLKAKPNLNL